MKYDSIQKRSIYDAGGGIIVAHDIGPELLVRRYLCDNDGYAQRIAETYI